MSSQRKSRPTPPPLAVGPEQGSAMLGVSRDHFERHIADQLRWVRSGRRKLVPVRELEAWVERNAARVLGESPGRGSS